MRIVVVVAALAGLLALTGALARFGIAWRDRRQLAADCLHYHEEQRRVLQQEREARIRARLSAFFPYLEPSVFKAQTLREAGRRAGRAIEALAGTRLGTTEFGIECKLPEGLRTRHVQIWARSGAGKSVAMMHMIADDLRATRPAALVVICPEPELHNEILGRAGSSDIVYFAPGDRECPIKFNPLRCAPGDDRQRHSSELFSTIKACMGDSKIGPRADPLLANAISLAMTDSAPTLSSIHRVLVDATYRSHLLAGCQDEYLNSFWTASADSAEVGARPVLSRLDGYLRSLRHVFEHPTGSFTVREIVDEQKVLLLDTSGLSVDDAALVSGLLTTMLRIELFRREASVGRTPPPVRLYVDEWPAVLGRSAASIDAWMTVLSRGRKYNCGIVVAGQFPEQVPLVVRNSVAGNVSTSIVLGLGAKSAGALKHEIVRPSPDGQVKPIEPAELVQCPVGVGYVRMGPGACAVRVTFDPPAPPPGRDEIERARRRSWTRYGVIQRQPESPTPCSSSQTLPPALDIGGRGGTQHRQLQALVTRWGEEHGLRARLEHPLLNGAVLVDVYLERDELRVAVEICLTNEPSEVIRTTSACLSDGVSHVVLVVPDTTLQGAVRTAVEDAVLAKDLVRVHVVSARGITQLLDHWTGSDVHTDRVAGYRVRTQTPEDGALAHRETLARVVADALAGHEDS